MDVPLYLYHSPLVSDFALLPSPPVNVTYPSSYSLFDSSPVAFVGKDQDEAEGGIELHAYYSVGLEDIQTTNVPLEELNQRGGDYASLGSVGWILSDPVTDLNTRYSPLSLTYSDSRHDVVTGPMNYADYNSYLNDDQAFRSHSAILGWAKAGSCDDCELSLSETFPSAGGADCPVECSDGESSFNAIYRVGKDDTMSSSEGGQNFLASMKLAGSVVKGMDESADPEEGEKVHVSFGYYCCQTKEEKEVILDVLGSTDWEPQKVTFDRVKTRIDNYNSDGTINHYSICAFLDEDSNERMMAWISQIEDEISSRGVEVNKSRKEQEPFHSTLVVVDGENFPVAEAMRRINDAVKPGTWTGAEQLTLTKPDF